MRRILLTLANCFLKEEQGAILVEMTLVTPLMVALSAGVFEFGNLIHQKLLIEAGLRDAARYAARCNSQMYIDYGSAAINCATNAENIAVFGNVAGTGTARVAGWSTTDVTVDIANLTDCKDAIVGGVTQYRSATEKVCIVRATSAFQYDGTALLAYLGLNPITLNGVHEERYIRF